jgi:hypothetical protein
LTKEILLIKSSHGAAWEGDDRQGMEGLPRLRGGPFQYLSRMNLPAHGAAGMDSRTREAFVQMVQVALQEPDGALLIERAKSFLFDELDKQRFNSSRATEVFRIAIEKAIWKKFGSVGALTTRSIKGTGVVEEFAAKETESFLRSTGAGDQRPARQGFLAFIIGK